MGWDISGMPTNSISMKSFSAILVFVMLGCSSMHGIYAATVWFVWAVKMGAWLGHYSSPWSG